MTETNNSLARPLEASPTVVVAGVAILAAGWLAAGSVGLMGAVLLRVLSWTALGVAVILLRPQRRTLAWAGAIVALLVGLPFVISTVPTETLSLPGYDVLLVAAVASVLAAARSGIDGRAIMASAVAVAVLAAFRIGCNCVPSLWHAADYLGHGLGTVVASICGRELWVGSSFGGIDFLVAMAAFSVVWLWPQKPVHQNLIRIFYATVAILVVQFVYLAVLSQAENLIAALPALPPPPSADPAEYRPPAWSLAVALRSMLPWCLPLVAMVGDLLVAAAMLRWAGPCQKSNNPVWHAPERSEGRDEECNEDSIQAAGPPRPSLRSGMCHTRFVSEYLWIAVVAALAAVVLTYAACPSDLSGKKIVAYADGDVWTLPQHEEYGLAAADAYGMLPSFVASLNGEFAVAESLSEADLQDADVLVMLDPAKPLATETLARVHDFVRSGGSLLLLAGPADPSSHDRAAVDAILEPTGLGVRFDMAVSKTPHWQDACRVFVHPATVGVNQRRNQFALNLGSSIAIRGGGQPMLVGRWGWCEPGSDMATTGVAAYGGGEKLGDVVLAAERCLGAGTLVLLSDTTGLTNIGLVGSHPFAGRLLGYLAGRQGNPRVWWRQLIGMVLFATLVWLIVGRRSVDANYDTRMNHMASRLAVAAVVFATAMAAAAMIGREVGAVFPDERLPSSRPIAYIDVSHFGINSDEPWVAEGTGGFATALMRGGYMPLAMYELSQQRLDSAAMLTIIGPGKPFTTSECESVERFVDRGGLLVCTIGAEESPAARGLLGDFRFFVPHSPVAPGDSSVEPAPVGSFPDKFGLALIEYPHAKEDRRDDYTVKTAFRQPWPVKCNAATDKVTNLVCGYGQPITVDLRYNNGHVVVVGDSHFVLNENLGYVDGLADEGVLANLDFWRWCLGRVTGAHDWFPPDRSGQAEQKQYETPGENLSQKENVSPPEKSQENSLPKSQDPTQDPTREIIQENPLRPEPLQPVEVKP